MRPLAAPSSTGGCGFCACQRAAGARQVAQRSQAERKGGGGVSGGRRQQQQRQRQQRGGDDVEIFNIDSGWNVEALEGVPLEDVADLLGGSSGWSVEAEGSDKEGEGGWSVVSASQDEWSDEEGDENDDEDDEQAGGSGRRGGGGEDEEPATFGGRELRGAEGQLVASLPRHLLRRLEAEQLEADDESARLKPAAMKKAAARLKTHQRLRVIAGSVAGRRLRSPQGDQTRPMMEMVRNAVFSMVMSLYGSPSTLPATTRWLDLYAGTGAVGIEALSRGVGQCHFVEMSPWVVNKCLMPNLEACEMESSAVVHTGKAEDFLRRAQQLNRFAGGPFDFMSVCPPYELVDYDEIFDLLQASPLLHEESIVIVEYPKKLASLVRQQLGPLEKLKDRRYGRTYMAVYGPPLAGDEEA